MINYFIIMRKVFLFFLIALMPYICLADFNKDKWRYQKEINTQGSGGLFSFVIDNEIFANTQRDLRDLRIVDGSYSETPYKLITSKSSDKVSTFYPKMINNSYVDNQSSSVILDFGENNTGVNRLKINTTSKNFQRNVKISGSNDSSKWNILADNLYIYDYTDSRGGVKNQNTTLNFPEIIYRYLKIEIDSIGKDPVKISSVEGYKYLKEIAREVEIFPKYRTQNLGDLTNIFVDLGVRGLPSNKIKLTIDDKNFNRGVTIYSSYDNDNWGRLDYGYIFKYNTARFAGENLILNFSETNNRYIKIVIDNKDDKPLNVNNVKTFSVYREVVFQAEVGKEYSVYYGNSESRHPEYDLEKYFNYLDLNITKTVNISEQKNNTDFVKKATIEKIVPKSEKIKNLMSASLVVASLLLLFLVFKFFQKK